MHIVVMPGDDIGPEISEVTMTMLETVNRAYALGMEFEIVDGPKGPQAGNVTKV